MAAPVLAPPFANNVKLFTKCQPSPGFGINSWISFDFPPIPDLVCGQA